jgi:hypothetical protein
VCEDQVLKRVFGSNREELAGGWRKLHKEELPNLYSSPHVRHAVTRGKGDRYTVYRTVVGNLKCGDHLGNPVADGRAIIKGR